MTDMNSESWDERYRANDLVWSAEPNLFLPPLVDGMAPGTALDVACGEGRNAVWLARQGWDVTGVDFSAVGIGKARKIAGETHVEWVVDDATTYVPDKSFDLAIIFYLQLPHEQVAAAIKNSIGALAPGGTLFAVAHALRNLTDGYGGPPSAEISWSEEQIAPLLSDLDVIELGERERYVESADATAIDLITWATKPS